MSTGEKMACNKSQINKLDHINAWKIIICIKAKECSLLVSRRSWAAARGATQAIMHYTTQVILCDKLKGLKIETPYLMWTSMWQSDDMEQPLSAAISSIIFAKLDQEVSLYLFSKRLYKSEDPGA